MYQGDMRSNGGKRYRVLQDTQGETRRNEGIKRGQSGNIIDTEHIPMIEKCGGRVRVVQEEEKVVGEKKMRSWKRRRERLEVVSLILVNTEPHRPPSSS